MVNPLAVPKRGRGARGRRGRGGRGQQSTGRAARGGGRVRKRQGKKAENLPAFDVARVQSLQQARTEAIQVEKDIFGSFCLVGKT